MDREDATFIGALVGCVVGAYGMLLVVELQKTTRKTNQFISEIIELLNPELLISVVLDVLALIAGILVWVGAILLFAYMAAKAYERITGWTS